MAYDAVIIGSGISGLTAALLLAKHGRRVVVVEKSHQPSPLLRGFSRQGIHCETGLHFTGMLAPGLPLHRFLCYLGVLDSIDPLSMPQMDGTRIIFTDGHEPLNIPWGQEVLQHTLVEVFPQDQRAITSYLSHINQELNHTPFFSLKQNKIASFGSPISNDSLALCLKRLSNNNLLHMALSLRCALHGVMPEDVSFTLHARVDGGFQLSSHSISGGGAALVTAMLKKLEQYGGEILTGCELKAINTEKRKVQSIILANGQQLESDICIFTAHPGLLPDMLEKGQLRPSYTKRLLSLPETMAPFIIYGALPVSSASTLANRSFFICPQDNISDCMNGKDANKSMICVSVAAPDNGMCSLSIMTALPANLFTCHGDQLGFPPSHYYLDLKEKIANTLLQRVYAALPEMAGKIKTLDTASPLTFANYINNARYGIYGVYHSMDTSWLSPLTSIRGLLLAGQSIVLPGILGSMASSFLAGGLLLGMDNLLGDLAKCYGGE